MKKVFVLVLSTIFLFGCQSENNNSDQIEQYIDSSESTIKTRIIPPVGFEYKEYPEDTFENYVMNLKVLEDKSPVKLYDNRLKGNQNNHVAIIDLDVGQKDLQQCADAIMRIRAEYLFSQEKYDDIMFHLANGFLFKYSDYREGNRLEVDNLSNSVNLVKKEQYDDSYESFRKYLDDVFNYANTVSLKNENVKTNLMDIKPGDFFVDKEHADIVVGVAYNEETKQTAYLLAQSYMPAQSIHVLKNSENSPWYIVDASVEKIVTPTWTFNDEDIYKFK